MLMCIFGHILIFGGKKKFGIKYFGESPAVILRTPLGLS